MEYGGVELYIFGVAYGGTFLYLGYWLGEQVTRRAWEQSICQHRWEYRSLDNLDHYWQRVCLDCTHYEKLNKEDVPYNERCKAKNFPPKGER